MIVMNEHTDMVAAPAQLRALLRPRILRPVHAVPRRLRAGCARSSTASSTAAAAPATSTCCMELEKTMGIMPGTTICGLADGTAWATRTFINKFYDEFAARCPEEQSARVPLTIKANAAPGDADGFEHTITFLFDLPFNGQMI